MTRITQVDPTTATGKTTELLDAVQAGLELIPNMTRAMAISPTVLEGYLGLNGALVHGVLPARVREQIALMVAQADRCDYCLAAHTAIGARLGLAEGDLLASRRGTAADPKAVAALAFARALVTQQGAVTEEDVRAVRAAGYSDEEIAEIIAHVALNIFTNYFNVALDTDLDLPRVERALPLSA
jgi:uncharacterized peroxidase-related enzyme